MKHWLNNLGRWIAGVLMMAGIASALLLALAFTQLPWKGYVWLSATPQDFQGEPDYIVILGGGGIPSKSGLLRSYYGAQMARAFPEATVVLSLPYEGDFETSAAGRMRQELILRGVAPDRILLETQGRNTREQAVSMTTFLDADPRTARILLVTSPDHMKRAFLSFRKAGFGCLATESAFSESVEADLRYDSRVLGGDGIRVPEVGGSLTLRYDLWSRLYYEIDLARELTAMAYYKLQGWI